MQAPLTRLLCIDMEVLYWKHVKEQLETLRKLQRREASPGPWPPNPQPRAVGGGSGSHLSAQAATPWLPEAEEGLWPVEEDRLEELEEAGGCSQVVGGGGSGQAACSPASCPFHPPPPNR